MAAKDTNIYNDKALVSSYASARPRYPFDLIDRIMWYLKEKRRQDRNDGMFGRLLDVGCGSGQATRLFAPYFDSVLGTDISLEQISLARKNKKEPHVSYEVVSDGKFPVEDETVDLIVCATAVHWMDINEFTAECERVLKPGGVVALFEYYLASIRKSGSLVAPNQEELDTKWQNIMRSYIKDIGGHPRNDLWLDEYRAIFEQIPQTSKTFLQGIEVEEEWSFIDFKKCWASKGEYHRLMTTSKPSVDPLEVLMERTRELLGVTQENDDNMKVLIKWRYPTIVFTKT